MINSANWEFSKRKGRTLQKSKKRRLIVFEIGTSAVKKIQVDLQDSVLFWNQAESIEFSAKEEDREKKENAAFSKLLASTAGLGQMETFLVFNSPQRFVREVLMPKIPLRELEAAVRIKLRQESSFPIEEAHLDYQVSETKRPGERDRFRVIAAASPQKALEEKAASLKSLGFNAKDIIDTPFTLHRLRTGLGLHENEVVALIDIGATYMTLNIFQEGELKFERKIQLGCNDLVELLTTESVLEKIGLPQFSTPEIEDLLKTRGVLNQHPFDKEHEEFEPMQYLSTVRSVLEKIRNEIVISFNVFSEDMHGKSVNRVLLSGGGALLKGFDEFLGRRLQLPVSVVKFEEDAGSLVLSDELKAKREELPKYMRLLFVLSSRLEEKKLFPSFLGITQPRWIQIGAGAFVLLVLFLAVGFTAQVFNKKRFSAQWEQLSASYEAAKGVKEIENNVLAKRAQLAQFFVNEPYWEDVFRELTQVLPLNFQLQSVAYQAGALTLLGTYSAAGEQKDNLTELLTSLSRGVFKDAKLISVKEMNKKDSVFKFEITCHL